MITVDSVPALREHIAAWRQQGKRIAFVPTMGNLHAGHLSLVQQAHKHADVVVASIFVNPMQFGPQEDFTSYPRTTQQDADALASEGVALLFLPQVDTIYPRGVAQQTFVEVPGMSDILCGASRPGHFRGVATVVNRLFNLVQPDIAVFGKKDYQQLLIIRMMVADLGMPVEIIGVDTVRESDGLALSSRNQYLTAEQRQLAPTFYTVLTRMRDSLLQQQRSVSEIEVEGAKTLSAAGLDVDYVAVRRQQDLAPGASDERHWVILAAVFLGKARLIDNIEVELGVSH